MKIIFLLPHLKKSGGVRVILNYAHHLAEMGHVVLVVVESKSKFRVIKNIFFHKHSFLPWNTKIKILRLSDLSFLPKADIIVADSWQIAQKISRLSVGVPKIHFIQHDERLYHGPEKYVSQVYKLDMPKVVVSSWLKDIMRRDFNFDVRLLLNPTNLNIFYPRKKLNDGKIRILLMYHDYLWKGSVEGAQIINELKIKYSKVEFLCFGHRKKEIKINCDKYYYNLSQNKLAEIYSLADIYLCSSWYEGSGLPSMEAMACRTALVTYNNGGSGDYAFDGKTALVAQNKNFEDLKNKLELLITNNDLRNSIAYNGYDFVRSISSWAVQAKKLELILKDLIKK